MNDLIDLISDGAGWRQTHRLLTLTTPAGADALLAETATIDEALGPVVDHAGFRIDLTALSVNADLPLTALLGQPARLDLQTSASRTVLRSFHGHITRAVRLGADGGFARYRLTIEPWLSFLGQTQDSYLFQDKTVVEIIDELLGDWNGRGKLVPAWRWNLADPAVYPKRGMTTQYRESDLAFFKRLLAEEGLFCWFEHQADSGDTLAGEYTAATWRFHPREFISSMRKCGWLSKRQLMQLIPSHAIRRHGQSHLWEAIPQATFNAARDRVVTRERLAAINRMLRKHGINTSMRQASFFGNAVQETVWLSTLAEQAPNVRWYAPWYGRGLLQLTHPDNYIGYWRWRGRSIPAALETTLNNAKAIAHATGSNQGLQDANFLALTAEMLNWREEVEGGASPPGTPPSAEENHAPADSAGYYWVKLRMACHADDPHDVERVAVNTSAGIKVYYRSPTFWRVSAAVNLPGAIQNTYSNLLNGFDGRCSAYGVALAVLSDVMLSNAQGQAALLYPEGYTWRAS